MPHSRTVSYLLVLLFTLVEPWTTRAQVAVTEVMSKAERNPETGFHGAEYFELTNFGSESMDLTGYGFRDGVPDRPLVVSPLANLMVGPGESVIFFRLANPSQSVTTAEEFRAWWGDGNLPADLQIRTWNLPGLSGWDGDGIQLFDAQGTMVDSVQFGPALPGKAFVYDPESGVFGLPSQAGNPGNLEGVLADDVGSPGFTAGSVPLHVIQQPADLFLDLGMTAEMTFITGGLPRPRFQWFLDGVPVAGGHRSSLVISNLQPSDSGTYRLLMTNQLTSQWSEPVSLQVNTNPTAPSVVSAPAHATVFPHQTARFTVAARGVPLPTYQWQFNGADIPGAVDSTLEVADADEGDSGNTYSVKISNAMGSTTAEARLSVIRHPDLRFTEVMALPGESFNHFDWFEITNYDTRAVDLQGWRFFDEADLERAIVITNAMTLQPGESAIFAERLSAPLFKAWWGEDSLPESIKIFTYTGMGLGSFGDTVFLWNPGVVGDFEYPFSLSWAGARSGISFETDHYCDPDGYGCLDEGILESIPGERGAFLSRDSGDIGSPGYVTNPSIQILSIERVNPNEVRVRCRLPAGQSWRLQRAPSPRFDTWTSLGLRFSTNNVIQFLDSPPESQSGWYYRVEGLP